MRLHVAVALAHLGDDGGDAALVAALTDDDVELACLAAEWLGALGRTAAVEPLIMVLETESAELRAASATALGELGDPGALAPLERLADDPSELPAGRTVGAVATAAARQIRERG